jgi:hypothetical protein
MDRRTSLKWMMVVASLPLAEQPARGAEPSRLLPPPAGYGTDPNLVKVYRPGEPWPLSFTESQRACAAALCATIIPADAKSPSAAQLNVHVFIDEWISAPYPRHVKDREMVIAGLVWLDDEAADRFKKPFAELTDAQRVAICDDIAWGATAKPGFAAAARFFTRFRDLTADGFYTTPEGMKDIGYTGNKPSATFAGPPPAALKKAGLIK